MSTVLSSSTAVTDLPAARTSDAAHRLGGPTRVDVRKGLTDLVAGAYPAVVPPLGGPWAMPGIGERPPEAANRGLWAEPAEDLWTEPAESPGAEPDAETPERPRTTYLELEGDLEGDDK